MTDSARKEYLNQFFGSKRYLYQNNERVAHIHVLNDTYYFHGHIVPGWQGVKKTFDYSGRARNIYKGNMVWNTRNRSN
ncbi:phage conserved Open Reading Frame 51 [Staphylococcus aureus]|uniref:Phage conserved Open Reading Frame 51 n=1 Tax=Staphylococcus aureus TaxID=1280 RepID=A0A380EII9_STAAU|nr:phage conserved Open Reading Frame 51 [Staphylococcus aureus]